MNHYNYYTNQAYSKKNIDILTRSVEENGFVSGNDDGIHFWMTFSQVRKVGASKSDGECVDVIVKGAKGTKIVVPVGTDANGEPVFRSTYVFHVSQTEKKIKGSKLKRAKRDMLMKLFM